jgi:transcriptional regulator with GAF, ATPase, and Fis domain
MPEILSRLEVRQLMDELASQLVAACDAALARVWLIGPGDECDSCAMRPECPIQIRCLHLASSAGTSTRIDGAFHRFPLGARAVGQTAVNGVACLVASTGLANAGLAEASWLAAHQVRSFAAVPLKSGARILGVLAVFSRRDLGDDEVRLLQLAASQAARAAEVLARIGPPADTAPREAPIPEDVIPIDEAQRRAIARAIESAGGRISGPRGAAARLGIHPNTLASRMIRLGMRRRGRRDSRA